MDGSELSRTTKGKSNAVGENALQALENVYRLIAVMGVISIVKSCLLGAQLKSPRTIKATTSGSQCI